MKTQKLLITLAAAAALSFITGCQDNSNKPSDAPATKTNAAASVATEAAKVIEAAAPAAQKAIADTKAAATTAANDTVAKANTIIDQAKALVSDKKYSEALNSLQSLSGFKLTTEQDKIVAGLKDQIQKAMAAVTGSDSATAVGNMLKK